MPLSADQLKLMRGWIGTEPPNIDLNSLYTLLANADDVVRYVLRQRIIDLADSPSSISVPGLSISNGQNILTLQALLKDFNNSGGLGLDGDFRGITTAQLVRCDRR